MRYFQADTTLPSMTIKTNPFTAKDAKDAKDAKERQYLDSRFLRISLRFLRVLGGEDFDVHKNGNSTSGRRPPIKSAVARPEPQASVQPSVPWPVFRYRLR